MFSFVRETVNTAVSVVGVSAIAGAVVGVVGLFLVIRDENEKQDALDTAAIALAKEARS